MLLVVILSAPWFLFFDPIGLPGRGHIARDPLAIYRLYSDDFAYVSASRTMVRTLSNLFLPHNTHIVPSWRVLTWGLVAMAGTLTRLPEILAVASYAILVAVMLLTGSLVSRETGRPSLALGAMAAVGTTSLMLSVTAWYSAGQTLWAGFGILATLWYAQSWRRSPSLLALALACVSAVVAGWFWTIGHMSGPVASVYLALDGRRRCRLAAPVPLATSVLAALVSMLIAGHQIDSKVSFHGRTTGEAARPIEGVLHTAQAIPENLVMANLGLNVETTEVQGCILTSLLFGSWIVSRRRTGRFPEFRPLETAGAALVLGSYLVEWTVRGYMPYQYLRTLNLGMIVPWYDAIPHIGFVLFLAGWISGKRPVDVGAISGRSPIRPTRSDALAIGAFLLLVIALNRPRVDLLWRNTVPPLLASERKKFPILELQNMRASALLLERAEGQRRHLRRMDQAQLMINRAGIGRKEFEEVFGRLDVPELPAVYDGAGLLDFPEPGRMKDLAAVRRALAPYLYLEPETRPAWLEPGDSWPPPNRPRE